jgi:hypothetical protein
MTVAEPTILRTTNVADFLSTVPALCGFTARNSIVVIPFVGKRSRSALRIDLPEKETTSVARDVGGTLVRSAKQLAGADGIAVVIYTDASFAKQHGTPHLQLWRGMKQRIERSGLDLKAACCVASDGWASYLDSPRPVGGHPLAEITESRTALEAKFLADELPDVTGWAELPPADSRTARLVADAAHDLLDYGDRVDAFGIARPVFPDPVELAERTLASPASELPPSTLAALVAMAHRPLLRDTLLIALAFGPEAGNRTFDAQLETLQRSRETGETFDEIARAEIAAGRSFDDDLMLAGRSEQLPDNHRVLAAIDALRRAAAHAPPSLRAGVLCVLSWMIWSRGILSAADRMRELAAAADPELRMVETLGWLIDSGYPGWAAAARRR